MTPRDQYSFYALQDKSTVTAERQELQLQDAAFPPAKPGFLPNLQSFTRSFSRPARPRFRGLSVFDWTGSWTWETAGSVLSIACAIMLIVFLKYVDGRPYGNWQYRISPNATISLIITIAKATTFASVSSCLAQLKWTEFRTPKPLYNMKVLDMASRGPWSAFETLWTVRPGLATAGALLMISSVAVDPLAQQVLSFPDRLVPYPNETAYAQSTHEYWPHWTDLSNHVRASNFYLAPMLQLATLNGLGRPQQPVEPVCTSTKCEYPDFVTMGICNRCEDVTTQASQSCKPLSNKYYLSQAFYDTPLNCTMTSPSGFQMNSEFNFYDSEVYNTSLYFTPVPWTSVPTFYDDNHPLFGIERTLVAFFGAKFPRYVFYTRENATTPLPKPAMTECAAYFCEQRFTRNNFTVNDRRLRVTETQPLFVNYSIQHDLGYYPVNTLVSLHPPNGTETLSSNSSYGIDFNTYEALRSLMSDIFNQTDFLGSYDEGGTFQAASTLWNTDDISSAMESMTTSMSNEIRSNSPQREEIRGTAFETETYIHVRWPWIILPLADVFLSIILFLSTAITSRSSRTILWKSSALPLLVARLQTNPNHNLGPLRNVDDLDHIAKQIRVTIEERDGPLHFVER